MVIHLCLKFGIVFTNVVLLEASCQVMLDLASRPQYFQPLRAEIEQVIKEDGHDEDGDGFLKLKKGSLTKLRKLDSFMKESQRLNPATLGELHMSLCSTQTDYMQWLTNV